MMERKNAGNSCGNSRHTGKIPARILGSHSVSSTTTGSIISYMESQTNLRRVAIATGAAQGIEKAIALRFARDGLDVVVNVISRKPRESVISATRASRRTCAAS